MNSVGILSVLAVTLMLATRGESLVALPGPGEPGIPIGPICPFLVQPLQLCIRPSYIKCTYVNGCRVCKCHNPCKPILQPFCKPPAVKKCTYLNGCPVSCKCHLPCPSLRCLANAAYNCPNGVLLDNNGCLTCTCRPPYPCEPCTKCCSMGYIYSLDSKGCRKCRCKD